MKRIAIPGEIITNENKKILSGAYKTEEGIKSLYLGVVYENDFGVKVVPLNGKYSPKIGDIVIGKVISDENFFYILDINSYKYITLSKRDVKTFLNKNEVLVLRINEVNELHEANVEFIEKLSNGFLVEINSKKVPRVIGKAKSMQTIIEKYTKTKLLVGANGFIYVIGENVNAVKEVLEKISKYSHVDNLTNKIEDYLKQKE